jgi:PEP-CTERM motif
MSYLTRSTTRWAAAATLLVSSLAAQATVAPGYWGISPRAADGTQTLMVYQNDSSSNSYGVRTTYNAQAGTLSLGMPTLGAPASLFLMTPGQVIGTDNWLSLPGPLPGSIDPQSGSDAYFQAGSDFYLGTATIAIFDPEFNWATVNTTRTSFGWAHLQAQADGSLKILASAMAFREPGIVIGAVQTAVPEPGTWAMMGLGMLGLAAVARRHRPA